MQQKSDVVWNTNDKKKMLNGPRSSPRGGLFRFVTPLETEQMRNHIKSFHNIMYFQVKHDIQEGLLSGLSVYARWQVGGGK